MSDNGLIVTRYTPSEGAYIHVDCHAVATAFNTPQTWHDVTGYVSSITLTAGRKPKRHPRPLHAEGR